MIDLDLDLRLAALSNLVSDPTPAVEAKLLAEMDRVEGVLNASNEYDDIAAALKVLTVLASRFSFRVLPMLTAFVRSVPERGLTWGGEPIIASHRKYRSADQLIREAVDVPQSIRYIHIDALLGFLLEIWHSKDKDTSSKAERALESLATFDLNLFYGDPPVGARPQQETVDYFAKMENEPLLEHASIVLSMFRHALSPSIEGYTWNYSTVNIRHGGVPAGGGVAEMRNAAIALLKRIYRLSPDVPLRKRVLETLGVATRREHPSSDAQTSAMFDNNAVEVLNFLRDQVATQELQVVQAIEHDAYWNYYHSASTPITEAALEVRDAVAQRAEYQIYKDLIGFEGIHGVWEELKDSHAAWEDCDKARREAAERYLQTINDANYDEWRDRILELSKARSDDLAMFPIFYDFLKSLAQRLPAMALELVQDHEERMQPFIIALLRGLWASDRAAEALVLAKRWMADRSKLAAIAKSLNVDQGPQFELLAEIMDQADRVNDAEGAAAIIESMGIAARLFGLGHVEAKAIFQKGMRMVARRHDAHWVNGIWFNQDFRKLVEPMDQAERAEVLASIASVRKIGYQAEEVLAAIGQTDPQAVLAFLMDRVRAERDREKRQNADGDGDDEDRFEAIPYNLHTLDKLLSPMPSELLRAVRAEFTADEARMFPYYAGARLIKAVFPEFDPALQAELLSFSKTGHPTDMDFVIGVVRTYGGEVSILDICKEIIKVVPERSSAWNEVATALESTGIVTGEYGFVQAYETKREEIAAWKNDENPRVQSFAVWLTESLDQMIVSERQRADGGVALRKHRYVVSRDQP
ncbi:MAG: hypothetical protein PHH58_07815 [Rhodoferax sp.]|nr:hypothetical protein [Rhodoferax sp.]